MCLIVTLYNLTHDDTFFSLLVLFFNLLVSVHGGKMKMAPSPALGKETKYSVLHHTYTPEKHKVLKYWVVGNSGQL